MGKEEIMNVNLGESTVNSVSEGITGKASPVSEGIMGRASPVSDGTMFITRTFDELCFMYITCV